MHDEDEQSISHSSSPEMLTESGTNLAPATSSVGKMNGRESHAAVKAMASLSKVLQNDPCQKEVSGVTRAAKKLMQKLHALAEHRFQWRKSCEEHRKNTTRLRQEITNKTRVVTQTARKTAKATAKKERGIASAARKNVTQIDKKVRQLERDLDRKVTKAHKRMQCALRRWRKVNMRHCRSKGCKDRQQAARTKAKAAGKAARAQEKTVRTEVQKGKKEIKSLMLQMLKQKAKAQKAVRLEKVAISRALDIQRVMRQITKLVRGTEDLKKLRRILRDVQKVGNKTDSGQGLKLASNALKDCQSPDAHNALDDEAIEIEGSVHRAVDTLKRSLSSSLGPYRFGDSEASDYDNGHDHELDVRESDYDPFDSDSDSDGASSFHGGANASSNGASSFHGGANASSNASKSAGEDDDDGDEEDAPCDDDEEMLDDEEDYEPDYDHQSEDDDDPFADETDTAITNASASSSPKNSNGSSLHGKSNGTNVSSPVEDRKNPSRREEQKLRETREDHDLEWYQHHEQLQHHDVTSAQDSSLDEEGKNASSQDEDASPLENDEGDDFSGEDGRNDYATSDPFEDDNMDVAYIS